MEVSLAVLAEAANVSDGKLNILGEFNTLWAAVFPARIPMTYFVCRIDSTPDDRSKHRLAVRVTLEGAQAYEIANVDMQFDEATQPGLPLRSQWIVGVEGAVFPRPGTYLFEVIVDGVTLREVPLYVFPKSE